MKPPLVRGPDGDIREEDIGPPPDLGPMLRLACWLLIAAFAWWAICLACKSYADLSERNRFLEERDALRRDAHFASPRPAPVLPTPQVR